MKLIAVALLACVLLSPVGAASVQPACATPGGARAFASVTGDRQLGVGDIPSVFSGQATWFGQRFNCTRASAQVRRVDLGLYQVRFPGIHSQVAVVSAISDVGASASVHYLGQSIWQIALRGPLIYDGALVGRDIPFSLVVYG